MNSLKNFLFCLLFGFSPSIIAQYDCIFYATLENAIAINQAPFDSIQITKEWNGDPTFFKKPPQLWRTYTASNYPNLIDSTHYFKLDSKTCWGPGNPRSCKNKIKRNKEGLLVKVKSAEFICDYTYDQNNWIKTVRITYRIGATLYTDKPSFAEFMYNGSGEVIALRIKPLNSESTKLDYFTIAYF
jgi:hypothetical protein